MKRSKKKFSPGQHVVCNTHLDELTVASGRYCDPSQYPVYNHIYTVGDETEYFAGFHFISLVGLAVLYEESIFEPLDEGAIEEAMQIINSKELVG